MSDKDDSLFLELYKARMQYFANQGDRTWIRFYYFLTVEIALASIYLAADKNLVGATENLLPFLGILFSLLWYLILQRNVADKITKKTKAWYVSPITNQVRRRTYHASRNYNRDTAY